MGDTGAVDRALMALRRRVAEADGRDDQPEAQMLLAAHDRLLAFRFQVPIPPAAD